MKIVILLTLVLVGSTHANLSGTESFLHLGAESDPPYFSSIKLSPWASELAFDADIQMPNIRNDFHTPHIKAFVKAGKNVRGTLDVTYSNWGTPTVCKYPVALQVEFGSDQKSLFLIAEIPHSLPDGLSGITKVGQAGYCPSVHDYKRVIFWEPYVKVNEEVSKETIITSGENVPITFEATHSITSKGKLLKLIYCLNDKDNQLLDPGDVTISISNSNGSTPVATLKRFELSGCSSVTEFKGGPSAEGKWSMRVRRDPNGSLFGPPKLLSSTLRVFTELTEGGLE